MTEQRPWGEFHVLKEEEHFKLKKIVVNPGHRLSYQYHHKREENWIVIAGIATVILNEEEFQIGVGRSIFIPISARHRLINRTDRPLELIEVQTGTYFGEDDIIRIDDDYNRINHE